jgi:hypothetical protein
LLPNSSSARRSYLIDKRRRMFSFSEIGTCKVDTWQASIETRVASSRLGERYDLAVSRSGAARAV